MCVCEREREREREQFCCSCFAHYVFIDCNLYRAVPLSLLFVKQCSFAVHKSLVFLKMFFHFTGLGDFPLKWHKVCDSVNVLCSCCYCYYRSQLGLEFGFKTRCLTPTEVSIFHQSRRFYAAHRPRTPPCSLRSKT